MARINIPTAALSPEESNRIRNVALLGHTQSGKTQLAEALLATSGRIPPLGVIEGAGNKDRVMDGGASENEKARGITYQTGSAATAWRAHDGAWTKINFFDTPGAGELFSDSYAALAVAGGGILAVSGADGVRTVTRRALAMARERKMGLMIAVTKIDKENVSFASVCAQLTETFGRGAVPVNLPIGEAGAFKGVIDLLEMKAYYAATDGSGEERVEEIPKDLLDKAKAARTVIEELAAESNEELLEQYFETGDLSEENFIKGVHEGVRQGSILPVMAVSSTRGIGLRQILNRIVEFLPTPAEHEINAIKATGPAKITATVDGPAVAFVFRTAIDPYAGTISYMKLLQGKLITGQDVLVHGRGTERLAHLYTPLGVKLEEVQQAVAGDVFCAVKLRDVKTGDSLHGKETDLHLDPIKYPTPSLSMALTAASRAHEDKLSASLDKLLGEDPRLGIDRDPESHEMVLMGAGQLHLEMALARLKERYGVEVTPHAPSIPYKETIKGKAEIHSRHKKQTGGHGQFADIKVRLEPLPFGKGFEFAEEIVGGVVPRNFIPAVEKGMQDARQRGALAGFPAVDFKVTLFDGSYHPVDSSDMAFQIASRGAFREGWPKCKPTLLEPIMSLEIAVPEECVGDVMGDLNRRRGRVRGMVPDAGETTIQAEVPLVECQTYANTLKALTADRGNFTMTFMGYEEVPAQLQAAIIAANAKQVKEEE